MVVKVIYMKIYITDMPYITGQYNFSLVLRDRFDELGMKLKDLDLSTHMALLTFFQSAVLQNLF